MSTNVSQIVYRFMLSDWDVLLSLFLFFGRLPVLECERQQRAGASGTNRGGVESNEFPKQPPPRALC